MEAQNWNFVTFTFGILALILVVNAAAREIIGDWNQRFCPNVAAYERNCVSSTVVSNTVLRNNRRDRALEPIYKVIFYNRNQVYEIFVRQIYQSDMYGFIEVEEVVFGERNQLVVDPAEEKLKNEFAGVKRSYIPMQSIIRIDEVEKEGAVKVSEVKANDKVAQFPTFPQNGPGTSSD